MNPRVRNRVLAVFLLFITVAGSSAEESSTQPSWTLRDVGVQQGVNVRSAIQLVNPSGNTAWLERTPDFLWNVGDTLLILRNRKVLATGSVLLKQDNNTLIRLRPTPVQKYSLQQGDTVERISQIEYAGSECCTRVVALDRKKSPAGLSQILLAMGDYQDITPGMRFDLFRNQNYAGFCRVVEIHSEGAVAEVETALSQVEIQVGDQAILRSSEKPGMLGYVFRIVDDLALVSIGDLDGINLEMTLYSINPSGPSMTVSRVNADHCEVKTTKQPRLWSAVSTSPEDVPKIYRCHTAEIGTLTALCTNSQSAGMFLFMEPGSNLIHAVQGTGNKRNVQPVPQLYPLPNCILAEPLPVKQSPKIEHDQSSKHP